MPEKIRMSLKMAFFVNFLWGEFDKEAFLGDKMGNSSIPGRGSGLSMIFPGFSIFGHYATLSGKMPAGNCPADLERPL